LRVYTPVQSASYLSRLAAHAAAGCTCLPSPATYHFDTFAKFRLLCLSPRHGGPEPPEVKPLLSRDAVLIRFFAFSATVSTGTTDCMKSSRSGLRLRRRNQKKNRTSCLSATCTNYERCNSLRLPAYVHCRRRRSLLAHPAPAPLEKLGVFLLKGRDGSEWPSRPRAGTLLFKCPLGRCCAGNDGLFLGRHTSFWGSAAVLWPANELALHTLAQFSATSCLSRRALLYHGAHTGNLFADSAVWQRRLRAGSGWPVCRRPGVATGA